MLGERGEGVSAGVEGMAGYKFISEGLFSAIRFIP